MRRSRRLATQGLGGVCGNAYSAQGPQSKLPSRLIRMRDEVNVGTETFEKKLRYLLWIN